MRNYELTYLISSDFSEEEQKSLLEKIISHIQKSEGILKESKGQVSQKLTCPIKNHFTAFSTTLDFHCDPLKIAEIEKALRSESRILRFMILTKELKKPSRVETTPRRRLKPAEPETKKPKEKKVELKEIEEKLEEMLKE